MAEEERREAAAGEREAAGLEGQARTVAQEARGAGEGEEAIRDGAQGEKGRRKGSGFALSVTTSSQGWQTHEPPTITFTSADLEAI